MPSLKKCPLHTAWIATSKYNIGLHIQKENIQSVVCSFFRWIKREMLEWDSDLKLNMIKYVYICEDTWA